MCRLFFPVTYIDQNGLTVHNVDWIMACVTLVWSTVLVNGFPSSFFQVGRGLGQRCSLSPFLFIPVVDVISLKINKAKVSSIINGHRLANRINVSHLFFVNDILTFGMVSRAHWMAHSLLLFFPCKKRG